MRTLYSLALAAFITPAFADDSFTFQAPTPVAPVVTGLSPTAGPVAGGTQVRVVGFGFTGATAVNFGSVAAASFSVTDDNSLLATSPPQAAGTVKVTVCVGPSNCSVP